MDKPVTIVAVVAIIALLLFAVLPYASTSADLSGAVTGNSDEYEKCLANGKHPVTTTGKYTFAKWDWEWINSCREFISMYEKGRGANVPRTSLSIGAYNAFIESEQNKHE